MSQASIVPGSGFRSLVEVSRHRAATDPDRVVYTFLADGEQAAESLTHGGLDRRARALAAALQDAGAAGERALLLYPAGLEFIGAFFACLYAGVVAVPCYPPKLNRPQPRLRAIAADAGARVVLTTAALKARRETICEQAPELRDALWIAADDLGPAAADSWRDPAVDGGSLAFLQYTSGSTALPKGVMVTHGNLLHNQEMIRQAFGQSAASVIVGWLPLYHDMGLIGNVLQPLYVGARCVLMSPLAFLQRPRRWLEAVSHWRGTTSGGPNFAYELCLRKAAPVESEPLDLSSWRVAFNGAEPVRAETQERFARTFAAAGFRPEGFYPCYGLAEATLFVTGGEVGESPAAVPFDAGELERHRAVEVPATDAAARRLVDCGRAWGEQEVRVVDPESGREKAPGEVGEIWVRGASVAAGYWRRPEETRLAFHAALADGGGLFLRTGDLGVSHGGRLIVTGRLKELIILRGRNLYPQDLERTAEASHPALRPGCGAAFPVEVEAEERLVLAHEVERHPGAGLAEVAAAVRRAVAEEHEVQVHDVVLLRAGTLLKTSSGKIQRRACAALYLAGGLDEIGRFPAGSAEPAGTAGEDAPSGPDGAGALETALRRLAAQALRVPAGGIDPAAPLTSLGLDSLAAVELSHRIERETGTALPMALLLEGASLGELARRLAAEPAGGTATAPVPVDGEEDRALSEGQRALLFAERLAPLAAPYNVAIAARIRGEVDAGALRRALQALVDRHPALRTAFETADGDPRRRVRERLEADFRVEAAVWNGAPPLDRIAGEAYRPFDLERDPLLRMRLFTAADGPGKALLVVAHHLVVDFWSLSLLARELAVAYDQERGNGAALRAAAPPAAGADGAVRYGDYVRWQRERLAGPAGERQWEHWRLRLAGALPALDLPTDRPRPAAQGWRGAAVGRLWSAELLEGLRGVARSRGATLFSPLLALFQGLLQRHSGQDDLIIGTPVAGRVHPDLANLVGYFVNTLPLRESLADDPAFAGLVARNRGEILAALEHQELPLPWLAQRLQPRRDPSRAPLFQALFVLQSAVLPGERDLAAFALGEDGVHLRLGGLELESLALPERRAPFDLTLMMAVDGEDRLALSLQYDAALFDATTVERMLARLEVLAAAAAAFPERRLSELPVLASGEREQVLTGWNPPDLPPLAGLCLHDLFTDRAAAAPEATALVARGESLTYRGLRERANRIAHHLRRLGVRPETRVGVLLERSADLVATLLGVLKAGGAYVPLDPAYPRQRLDYLMADSGAAFLVTRASLAGLLTDPAARIVPCEEATLAAESELDPEAWSVPGNLAYLIYTSGSTGRPKAVAIEHRSAVARMEWARRTFAADELAGVLAATSICFDLSVFEIFAPLSWGGAVVLAADALELPRLPAAGRVTLLNTVPSAAAELVRAGGLPAALRTVCLAGEPLKAALAGQILRQPAVRRLLNLYGPSEDTTYSTQSEMDAAEAEAPTIGRPLPGTRAYLLDRRLRLAPPGTPGELHLAGAGLSRGYLGRPELTAERFVPDPFSPLPGGRLYRTGDLARHRPDGRLDFLGRLDFQVKVRGFRIELGEVEAALERQPGVREAVVLAREDVPGDRRLVAYLGCGPDALGSAELRALLAAALPAWAVPSAFVVLESLPRTPTGKIDRGALPAPGRDGMTVPASAPAGPIEELLAGLWSELLGRGAVDRGDDFFALGGHSLLAMQVAGRIRQTLGVDLPLRSLMERPVLADLAAEVERALGGGPRELAGPVALAAGEVPPLSFVQERLWFLDQMEGGSPQYNMPAVVRLEGPLAAGVLAAALGEVVRRHQALRTTFQAGPDGPRVEVAAAAAFRLPEIDLSALPALRRDREAERIARAAARLAFDLRRAPLLRALLLRLGVREHRAVLVLHHAAGDGGSLRLLYREVTALYAAGVAGGPSPLPAPVLQYGDWAAWQRRRLQGELLESELSHWRHRLAGIPAGLDLPADRPRPHARSHRGAVCAARWPAPLAEGLESLARAEGGTLFMAALAGLAAVLARYTGALDLCVGTPVSTRDTVETEAVIGPFINNLVLRCDLAADPPFRDLIGRARDEVLLAHQHRWLPFERLVEELQPARDLARSPIFQVMLGVERTPLEPLAAGGVTFAPERVDNGTAKLDWTLSLESGPAGLEAALEYSSDLFDAATAARALSHLGTLLAGALAAPAAPLSRLPLLGVAEREQLLAMGEGAAREVPPVAVHELFLLQARRTPERIAVIAGGASLTYAELARRAGALALELRALGVGPETPVGLCLERSAGMVVAVLAVLAAGGCYVPLDPAHPRERLALVLEDAHPLLLLSESALLPALPASAARIVCLDGLSLDGGLDGSLDGDLEAVRVPAASLAYRIYTSGSTGRPKGVDLTHGGVVSFLLSMREILGLEAADVLVAVTTLAFDIAVLELLLPLTAGARVVLATREEAAEPERLAELLARQRATFLQATPATWRLLVESGWRGDPGLTMLCGGEALPTALAGGLARRGRRLWNLYGPTETTIWSAALPLAGDEAPVPIGGPIANTGIRILEPGLAAAPVGIPGELYIGGAGLARGYAGRPDLTAERFLPDPFALPGRAGARLYRTGDIARFRADGTLELLGRADHQVKIRGFRIELAEIEAALRAARGVADAVVVARGEGGEARLDGYYVPALVPAPEGPPTAAGLREQLAERLPAYMLPTFLVELPALPLTPNGKVDRQRLPPPATGAVAEPGPAGGDLEQLLAALWAETLGRERVGLQQSFFDLGGHSLLATRLVSRLRQVWGAEIPLRLLFEAPSAAAMARRLRSLAGEPPAPPLLPTSREEPAPLSFAQERVYFLSQLDPGSAAYNIAGAVRLAGALDVPALELALEHILARHDVLRTTLGPVAEGGPAVQRVAPSSPYRLPLLDLARLPEGEREPCLVRLAVEEAERPFDLARGPLLRSTLARLGTESHALFLTLHHAIADGWSLGLLMDEVRSHYHALSRRRRPELPPLPVQYADFARWQRAWLEDGVQERQLAYWRGALEGAPAFLALPTDRPRPLEQTFGGAVCRRSLAPELGERAAAFGRREGTTLFMVLMSAFGALLSWWTGQDDLVIGTDVANRNRIETEPLIGFFVNQLPLRLRLAGDPSFREMAARTREAALAAYTHQDLPFEKLVEVLRSRRSLSYAPVFQVKLNVHNVPGRSLAMPGLEVSNLDVPRRAAQLDMIVNMETEEGLGVAVEYNVDLFQASTIERLAGHFESVLTAALARPEVRLGELKGQLDQAERALAARTQQGSREDLRRKLKSLPRRSGGTVLAGLAVEPVEQGG